MKVIDAANLAKRNMATNGAGQLSTRPGLRVLLDAGASKFYGGFTVRDGLVGEVQHVIIAGADAPPYDLELRVYSESFALLATVALNTNVIPRTVTSGMVLRELMIGSPDFPTLWGIAGGTYRIATKVEQDPVVLTALEVPDGILTQWVNRIVIASGTSLYFSDPVAITGGSPRTFVAQNQNARPGAIFGLHIGAGGMLVCCTDQGTFGLDSSAAAVGIVGSNATDWRLLSHHETSSYGSTCAVNGRIYGLTKRGYRLIDVENAEEIDLDDPYMTRFLGTRISLDDYRTCRMYAGAEGPIIACDPMLALWVSEAEGGTSSWWTSPNATADLDFRVFGVLREVDGSDLLLCASGVCAMGGNFDGEVLISSAFASQPQGILHGTLASVPHMNETVRAVHASAANATVSAAIRGDGQTSAAYEDNVNGPVIGTSTWGGSWRHMTAPTVAHRLDFDVNSNDLAVEVGFSGADNRVQPRISVEDSKQGKDRPQDRG